MINSEERTAFFQVYLAEGIAEEREERRRLFGRKVRATPPETLISIARWAHAMSLIAEQFTDHYVGDDLEGEDEEEDAA